MDPNDMVIKQEPEIIIQEIDSDTCEDDKSNSNQSSIPNSISEDTTTSETYHDLQLNSQLFNGENELGAYQLGMQSFESADTLIQKRLKLNSNAQSMRDYRSRIRADPIKYEEYKARERVRNKRRCEKRRLERLAKKGIFPSPQDVSKLNERKPRNERLFSRIKDQQKKIDQIEIIDSEDDHSNGTQLPFPLYNGNGKDDLSTDEDNDDDDDDDDDDDGDDDNNDKIDDNKYSLESLFADLEKIANKRLPTNEIQISIPKPNKIHSRRRPPINNNKYLPEIDIFINDPKTLNRVPINGLPALTNIQSNPKQQNRRKIPMLPFNSSLSMTTNDVVDLTSDFSGDDNDSDANDIDINVIHAQLEPEIEIIEYPPLEVNSNQIRNFTENSSNNSSTSISRSSISSTDPPPGYIDSFMTFVSQQIEEEEREIIGRRLMMKRMQQS